MAYDTANTYETIELFGLTERDAQLPIPEDHVLTNHIIRESFEALLGQLRGTGLEAEIEPLAHGLATILQRRKVALGKEVDRTADKIGAEVARRAAARHATRERPVVDAGQIVIRPINYLALSYDHRIIDGREAVLGLVAMKEALEDPARLLFDI